jgi:hypothetical protein
MPCLRCGAQRQWEQDQRFCSASCRERFYGEAAAAPRKLETLDDVIVDTLIADYQRALREWCAQTGADVNEYSQPERARIYARHILASPFGFGHAQGLKAAWNDYGPEFPPIQRTSLQERMRARIVKFIAPTFKSFHADRADAYARSRVDLLDPWAVYNAVSAAVQAPLDRAAPQHERLAFEEEQRYEEGRRRW